MVFSRQRGAVPDKLSELTLLPVTSRLDVGSRAVGGDAPNDTADFVAKPRVVWLTWWRQLGREVKLCT